MSNAKSLIGHAIGAAGALELAGNLPSFEDYPVHRTINLDHLDLKGHLNNPATNEPKSLLLSSENAP